MARKMTEWPSKRGPITKIMPSDGCIGDTVPWRWESGTISTNLDGIWGMSVYWDQASVLVQAGLLDAASLPVTGRAQAAKLIEPSLPGNNDAMPGWSRPSTRPG